MAQWLCGVVHNGKSSTNAQSQMDNALDSMRDQLNNNTNQEFSTVVPSSYNVTVDPGFLGEIEFIERCLEELWNDNIAVDGDVWVIADGVSRFGYGHGGISWSPDGSSAEIRGGRALHTPSEISVGDHPDVFKNVLIQESGHCLDTWHKHGRFLTDINGVNFDCSPMLTCYGQTESGNPDTCQEGGDTPPESWEMNCGGNYVGSSWEGGCGSYKRHHITMTQCAMDQMANAAPF